jgi:hypothetical protein
MSGAAQRGAVVLLGIIRAPAKAHRLDEGQIATMPETDSQRAYCMANGRICVLTCSSQNRMSISRYIVVAVVSWSRA